MFLLRAIFYGIRSLLLYPLRSALTMLGLIFGVCSVIAMLAIGEGQAQQAEEEIKKLGAINVIITSQKPIEQEVQGQRSGFVAEYGITYADAERIAQTVPGVVHVLPEKIRREDITFDQFVKKDRQIYGTSPMFLEFSQAELVLGRFLSEKDEAIKNNVCVISSSLASELFAYQNPLTNEIKVGSSYYRVVGLIRTPGDLLADEKEHKIRQETAAKAEAANAEMEAKLAEQEKIIAERRSNLKSLGVKEAMVAEAIDGEATITSGQVAVFEENPPIVFQTRLEDQDTPESKWFADQSGREYFVTPDSWVYQYDSASKKAVCVGNLTHGRVMRMAMESDAGNKESDLGKNKEFYGDVYIPFSTARAFYGDREVKRQSGGISAKEVQIDRLRVQFRHQDQVVEGAKMLERTMRYGHKSKEDYIIRVPLDELETLQRVKLIFQIVLGSIAGISLIVGGIGIMNIMLATVTERTNEIGVRRALGAKKKHIVGQFLMETSVLSIAGGLLGIGLGYGGPWLAQIILEWRGVAYDLVLVHTTFATLLAFGVSVLIGIIFGIYPAYRAANLDPIEALRHT